MLCFYLIVFYNVGTGKFFLNIWFFFKKNSIMKASTGRYCQNCSTITNCYKCSDSLTCTGCNNS